MYYTAYDKGYCKGSIRLCYVATEALMVIMAMRRAHKTTCCVASASNFMGPSPETNVGP